MTAMIQRQHGVTLEPGRAPAAALAPPQIRVAVEYCGLNHLDLWLKRGDTGDKLNLPRIPGSDVLGTVSDVGTEVESVQAGDRVLLYPGRSCGHCDACERGEESACRSFQVLGYDYDGGYATRVIVAAEDVVQVPTDASFAWAAVPTSYITAWNALVAKAELTAGETVVVWGASGGLGNAALRIAESLDARPIAVVGSPAKVTWLREQGYTGTVLQRGKSLVKEVRELTGRAGAQVVLDHVGAETWMESIRMLTTQGRLAACGITSGHDATTDLRHVFAKQLSIQGTWLGDHRDLAAVVEFLRRHPETLPPVERSFPLSEANAAQSFLSAGGHSGKIVLEMP